MSGLDPDLLRRLRDREALPPPPSPGAHAAAMLRAHVLRSVSRAATAASVPVLLIKGAALALTVYPSPASRPMADIDVLVARGDRDRLLAALEHEGGTVHHPAGRPLSRDLLGETAVLLPAGALTYLVEVHTSLDKLVERPIPLDALFAKATPAKDLPGLFLPDLTDHALLVALHLAGHDFHHPLGLLDLELLLRRGLDERALVAQARRWSLGAVMFASLSTLRALGAASVSEALVEAFAPGPIQRALLRRAHPPGAAAPREGDRLGLPWVIRQTPLRDDPLAWTLGLLRFGALRVRERSGRGHGALLASRERDGQSAAVPYRVPRWVRAVLAVDRLALRLDNLRDGLRDELMLAFIPEADRGALTAALYADQSTYLPGGHRYQSGLFSWERNALNTADFPREGRVLLGACGAGRELSALIERGFTVTAFDPCGPFAEVARAQVDAARATVLQASYADLVSAAEGRGGPLAPALEGAPFAAVLLGWGSFSHVMPAR
ncbi:MAG: nucleotidyltransferase family protein, partial [Minicystis sp.]